jgi:tetratricopeptide (TPR) repeat protein
MRLVNDSGHADKSRMRHRETTVLNQLPRSRHPNAVRMSLLFVSFTLCVCGLLSVLFDGFASSRAWREVTRALSHPRIVNSRFVEASHVTLTRSTDAAALHGELSSDLLNAIAVLDQHAHDDPSAVALRRAAAGRILIDDLDAGVSMLERAAATAPADHLIRSDLAAAYLVRAERRQAKLDFVRALDSAVRVTMSSPKLGAGWFNTAVALERLGLTSEAAEAWRTASLTESDGWAQYADVRAQTLALTRGRADFVAQLEQIATDDISSFIGAAKTDPDLVGEIVERRLLRSCSDAMVAGQGAKRAPSPLQSLRRPAK